MFVERRAVAVQGIVQGVGFRPYVYGLATRLRLGGFVRNRASGVLIEVEGAPQTLDRFLSELPIGAPPLAQIAAVDWERRPLLGETGFRIEASRTDGDSQVFVSPDVATCPDCLVELSDPADRRFRYAFLNCTNCGPRLTIVTGAPYDRVRTTMARFEMCTECRAEYDNPADRRFHAQPTACPACGPRLALSGRSTGGGEPLADFATVLRRGGIGALMGLGGFHLVCDAACETAVATLRRRKHRDEKPFAVMVRDVQAADALCWMSPTERSLLTSPRRPIVLLRRRGEVRVARGVAPRSSRLGLMLPYTPLHELLVREIPGPLVMTSGNRSDEPIAHTEPEAFERLAPIADVFLTHNRPIHVRCDDSVTRVVDEEELLLRRSRGYAPVPLGLPCPCVRPTLAMGGQLKATFALGRGTRAFVSHHIGDLEYYEAYRAYVEAVALYRRLFDVVPCVVAHDLHPDYASTRHGLELARAEGLELVGVQHHHAHMASVMAEHGLEGPVIGVTFDGTGLGTDGSVWGGEFLVGGYRHVRRAAHLRGVPMPGGDRAIREPWRMAVAFLDVARAAPAAASALGRLEGRVGGTRVRTIRRMITRGVNAPSTSSVGRLFDAVAVLVAGRCVVSFEGQAAMELEWLAEALEPDGVYPFDLDAGPADAAGDMPLVVDPTPVVLGVATDLDRGVPAARIARRFHSTLAEIVASVCSRLAATDGVRSVVLSGGVFQNALLTREVVGRLRSDGFSVFRHRLVPPNDGGLSLGQLAVAAATSGGSAAGTR